MLPIALPGIVTGIALQSRDPARPRAGLRIGAGLFTVIVGHATFCIVVVFNNVPPGCGGSAARWRRPRPTWAPARPRPSGYVTFPLMRSALLAGALLAFALCFDEIS